MRLFTVILIGLISFPALAAHPIGNEVKLTAEEIQLWFHYEEIAMHFNELIIQYRLQLMGGTGAIGALGFFLIQGRDITGPDRRFYRLLLSGLLLVLVIAAALLDLLYYNELLNGAVKAILKYEDAHKQINMSTLIDKQVKVWALLALFVWYGAMIGPLTIFSIWSYRRYSAQPKTGKV